jgi:hypothetical protein
MLESAKAVVYATKGADSMVVLGAAKRWLVEKRLRISPPDTPRLSAHEPQRRGATAGAIEVTDVWKNQWQISF